MLQDFHAIDRERLRQKRSVAELCRTAGVAYSTYWFVRTGKTKPQDRTLTRLRDALASIKAAAKPRLRTADPELIRSTFNGYVVAFCRHHAITPEAVLASDPALRATANAEWQAAAKIRALAVYCIVIEFNLTGAAVARAIGLTRAGTSLILKRVEDLRDDPGTDAMIEKIGGLISGRAA